ncbi:hypothetical protein BUALT_Bualt07G0078700 [Buddleja alternifolia]|uniref:Myb/SANT-like domain-containing protein n=1 Tax=Buddleja alternifolia TaxID=168488 RepID=A0AAV6XJN7_9LAMI|nr:hypothetical protein BUALT_Bualt07G0078700 [Buddleja alternifolia]
MDNHEKMEMGNMNILSGKGTNKGAGMTSQGTQGRSSARPNSHFNRNGWNNLLKRFIEMTGRNYAYKQFRNHLDSMKKDWILFKKLMHQVTGIGWDPISNTIDACDEWWDRKLKLFSDVATMGERARAPSQRSGNELDSGEEMFEQNIESTEDQREHVEIGDSDDMEVTGSCNHNIASGSRQAHYTSEMFPPSTTIKRKSSDENTTKSSATSASSVEMTIGTTIEMLSSIPGVPPRSELWNYACYLLSKNNMQEVFASQPCHESLLCCQEFNYD